MTYVGKEGDGVGLENIGRLGRQYDYCLLDYCFR